jgi:hypothetical protein
MNAEDFIKREAARELRRLAILPANIRDAIMIGLIELAAVERVGLERGNALFYGDLEDCGEIDRRLEGV